jgi:hypothetical protein
VEKIRWIVAHGNGARRQLEVYRQTNDFRILMDFVASETEIGLDTDAPMENLNARASH